MLSRLKSLLMWLLFYVLIGVLLYMGAMWFADQSGYMVLEWNEYELTTTTANFVFALVLLLAVVALLITSIRDVIKAPGRWLKAREEKQFRQGLDHITNTMVAISIGDTKAAEQALHKARKTLQGQPVVPLLETQIAAASKDQVALQKSLDALQQYDQTKALASKGFAEMHMRKGELSSAIPYAQKAIELEPKNPQSFFITLALYVKTKQLVMAESLVEDAKKQRVIDKYRYKDLIAMLCYLRSLPEELELDKAQEHIERAYRLAPHQPHIGARYAELYNHEASVSKAAKVLRLSWEGCFTPLLYALAWELKLDDKARKKLYSKLIGLSPEGRLYAYMLLAKLAADQQDYQEAGKQLVQYNELIDEAIILPDTETLSEFEYQQQIDASLERAEQRLPKIGWVCNACQQKVDSWQAVCSNCQALNSLQVEVA